MVDKTEDGVSFEVNCINHWQNLWRNSIFPPSKKWNIESHLIASYLAAVKKFSYYISIVLQFGHVSFMGSLPSCDVSPRINWLWQLATKANVRTGWNAQNCLLFDFLFIFFNFPFVLRIGNQKKKHLFTILILGMNIGKTKRQYFVLLFFYFLFYVEKRINNWYTDYAHTHMSWLYMLM